MENLFEDFIYIFKDLLTKIDILLKSNKILPPQTHFLIDNFQKFYDLYIWKMLASNISILTIKGINCKEIQKKQEKKIRDILEKSEFYINEWKDDLDRYDLLLTKNELQKVINKKFPEYKKFAGIFEIWHFIEGKKSEKE